MSKVKWRQDKTNKKKSMFQFSSGGWQSFLIQHIFSKWNHKAEAETTKVLSEEAIRTLRGCQIFWLKQEEEALHIILIHKIYIYCLEKSWNYFVVKIILSHHFDNYVSNQKFFNLTFTITAKFHNRGEFIFLLLIPFSILKSSRSFLWS